MEAQRYPHDFNGILAGAPANIQSELIGEVESWVIRVNTGPGGREILTTEKLPALHAAVVAACGQGRGYVLDPRTCNFSPSSIECNGLVTNSCLTAAQVRVVASLYRGATDPAGQSFIRAGSPTAQSLRGRFGSSNRRQIGTGLTTHRPTGTQSIISNTWPTGSIRPNRIPSRSSPLRFRGTGS